MMGLGGARRVSVPEEGVVWRERGASGEARLVVEACGGRSFAREFYAREPFRWLVPRARGRSVWAYGSSFGGGFVSGDRIAMDVECGEGASVFVGTQASTKVYRSGRPGGVSQSARVSVGAGGFLAWVPDVIQPFAGSQYTQRQVFQAEEDAGLVLVDWFCSGRSARGERWQFSSYASRTEVWLGGRRLLVDALRLDGENAAQMEGLRRGGHECFALALVCGAGLEVEAAGMLREIERRPAGEQSGVAVAAGRLNGAGVLVRCSGREVEGVRAELAGFLRFIGSRLGENPLGRKS
ncbi:MAG: urease accessory protein UreD [Verrucomicrobiota bacterium]|jgi:urease accessory protein